MSCGCGCGGTTCRYTSMTPERYKHTLGRALVPVADAVRDLKVQLGLVPYRVSMVRVKWSGRRRGLGEPAVVGVFEILPTPVATDLSALTDIVQTIGREEQGSIMLTKISGRYTEDQLRGYDFDGQPIAEDEQVFWEIEFLGTGDKRRFVSTSAPSWLPKTFEWTMRLEKAVENRDRDGGLR